MRTFLAALMAITSVSAMADSLICKGFDTKTEIVQYEKTGPDAGATVNIWNREYEQARYSDLFDGYVKSSSVATLMKKKIITGEEMHGKFKLDLNKNVLEVTNRGHKIVDTVKCEYRK